MMGLGNPINSPFFHMANFWGIQPLDFWGALGILIPQYRVQSLRIDEHVSHEKKTTLLSIESWLVKRYPYFMAYEIIPI